MKRKHLPEHLHTAYDWTAAAGELDELRALTGEGLRAYCRESAANARDHADNMQAPSDFVTENELVELHDWLNRVTVETLTPEQIRALQSEAAQAGDTTTVNDCAIACGGYDSSCTPEQAREWVRAAKERICKVINDAIAARGSS